jgi:hypothetical protein
MPSSRRKDTPIYEALLRHRDDGRLAVISVKSGDHNAVPVAELAAAAATDNAEAFVCSSNDAYAQPPEEHGVRAIRVRDLVEFMARRPDLLPPRVELWL